LVLTHHSIRFVKIRSDLLMPSIIFLLIPLFLLSFPIPSLSKEDRVVEVVETASKSIVNIKTEELTRTTGEEKKPSFFKKYFAGEEEEEEISENIGSGVVLDPKGIIVTNEHLISRAINIRVKFINGKEYSAYVLGSDPEYDIALLKITNKDDFPYIKITKTKGIKVGEKAVVIGNPYGLSSSVTVGVVSALGRNLRIENRIYANLIQTDASINPGNSGGLLLDAEGNPLGIVTAIYGEGKGIGFAIPIEDVMSMLSEFLESSSRRPILGLFMEKRKDEKSTFLYVNRIIPKSPAEKTGIRAGDRIVELNKKKIREGMKLQSIIRSVKGKNTIQLKIVRGTKSYLVSVDLEDIQNYTPVPIDESLCGIRISDIRGYPKLKYKLKDREGVVVTKVYSGGLGEKAGLHIGDAIVKINNNKIADTENFNTFMIEGLQRNYILYQVKRSDSMFFLPVKLDTLL
jgi:serine protease Do